MRTLTRQQREHAERALSAWLSYTHLSPATEVPTDMEALALAVLMLNDTLQKGARA